MRAFDYSPFYRASVGFDRVFDLLDNVVFGDNARLQATPLFAAVDLRTAAWERGRPDPVEADALDCVDFMRVLLDKGANPNLALKGRMLQRYHANGLGAMTEGATPLEFSVDRSSFEIDLCERHRAEFSVAELLPHVFTARFL